MIFHAGPCAGLGAKTTRSASAAPRSNTFWRFLPKLPSSASYGWLPYAYVQRGLAEDFWSVLKKEWIDTGEFKI